jgi:ethanolamine transporter EutH
MTIWLYVALGVYAALCIIPVAFVGGLVSMIEYDFPSGGHLSLLLLLRDLVVVALVALTAPLWLPVWWLWDRFLVDSERDPT